MGNARRILLIDRDGVLHVDRAEGVLEVRSLRLLPGVGEAMARLRGAGWRVIVVTNQSAVGRGRLTPCALDAIHEELQRRIQASGGRIDAIYACPHAPDDGCRCRKPAPGLLEKVQADWDLDLTETWFVGDDARDVDAARAAGCRPALVRTGKGETAIRVRPDVPVYRDLSAFVDELLAGEA